MYHLIGYLAGVGVAVSATWFPGMLNMQVVSTTLRAGRRAGYWFSLGLAFIIAGQAGLAIFFSRYLDGHPNVLGWLRFGAAPLFATLATVFFIKGIRVRRARKKQIVKPYTGHPFWRGAGMAAMNVPNIPLFFALASWLVASGYLTIVPGVRTLFTVGVGTGAAAVFWIYCYLSRSINRRAAGLTRNLNFFIAGLLAVLAIYIWIS